jgi:mono/diheme cytochrome c family protein
MRTIPRLLSIRGMAAGAALFLLALAGWPAVAQQPSGFLDQPADPARPWDTQIRAQTRQLMDEGRESFRYDTFGSETFFGNTIGLHRAIAGSRFGGVGGGVSPKTALAVGLKVDADAIPAPVAQAIQAGQVDLNDPAVTLSLLQLGAVVGVTGIFNDPADATKGLKAVGLQCALCHSTVDDSFAPGIGKRLDGWPNQDLNVGAIINLAPDLSAVNQLLGVDDATTRKVLQSWGQGRFDAQLFLDGKGVRPDGGNASVLIPPAFGLAGVNNHTWTGSWGSVTYWNAFVANLEMHGTPGTFFDPRLDNAEKYPVAARARLGHVQSPPGQDRISGKLPALHLYQLALPAPNPPDGSFDVQAAGRGQAVFGGQARCATCHVPPTFTEPGWNLHTPQEIGIDDFQASRSPDNRYRTAPLAGRLFWRTRGFFHDGRFATLMDVVNHYNDFRQLGLSDQHKRDLVEYLKSI